MKYFLISFLSLTLGVGLAYWLWRPADLIKQLNYETQQKALIEENLKDLQDSQRYTEEKLKSIETELGFCIQGKG